MKQEKIEIIVTKVIESYCEGNDIKVIIDKDTPLIGSYRILDSMGLVNIVVDIETAFLDEGIEISLTSEAAMSSRISPFRTVGALSSFIAKQLIQDGE
jgi:acyl carrier protein